MRPTFREPFPIITVTNVSRSIAFYRDVLGFAMNFRWPTDESTDPEFATLALDDREIGIGRNAEGTPPAFTNVELCLEVDDIDSAWSWLLDHGATELQPPTRQPWGEANAYVTDPDGLRVHIYCKVE